MAGFGDAEHIVQIILDVEARNQQAFAQVKAQLQGLEDVTKKATVATKQHKEEQEKVDQSFKKNAQELRQLERAFIAYFLIIQSIQRFYGTLAKSSDSLTAQFEKFNIATSHLAGTIGNAMAPNIAAVLGLFGKLAQAMDDAIQRSDRLQGAVGGFGAGGFAGAGAGFITGRGKDPAGEAERHIKNVNDLSVAIAKARGDEAEALKLQIEQRNHLLNIAIRSRDVQKDEIELTKRLNQEEESALRRKRLGLLTDTQINDNLRRSLIANVGNTASNATFKLLQGESQHPRDIINDLRAGASRSVADFVGEKFKNFLFGENSPAVKVAKETLTNLKALLEHSRRCCDFTNKNLDNGNAINQQTAINTAAIARRTSSSSNFIPPNPPSGGGGVSLDSLSKAAQIASVFNKVGGGALPGIDGIPMGGVFGHASGGWIPAFPSGGEVPITAQPGEFVVRKSIAQENKDLLQDLNSGSRKVRGTTNVFMIRANDAGSFAQMLSSPASQAQLEIQLIKKIMTNGDIRRIIKDFAR